ncbi:MAG: NAD-dependent epimerase/dehydratase family protein [Eubacteriales bacterium]|nr:NAD-dependent epimerase/dehydratase family protein [Eubacteriales bacterium]
MKFFPIQFPMYWRLSEISADSNNRDYSSSPSREIYLVTGASGQLGVSVIDELEAIHAHIRCLLLEDEIPTFLSGRGLEFVHGDLREQSAVDALFANLGERDVYVIHLASKITIEDREDPSIISINVGGTERIVEACKRHGVKRLVYVSSVHAIEEPEDDREISETHDFDPAKVHGQYAKSKAMATKLVLEAAETGLDALVLQPSGIIGPNDYLGGHTTELFSQFLRRRLRQVVHGGYDFTDVRDVARAVVNATKRGRSGECYILANRYFEIAELLNTLAELTGLKKIRRFVPYCIAKAACPFFALYYRVKKTRPLFSRYSLYTLRAKARFSHRKASRELGYHPRPMRETLRDTLSFLETKRSLNWRVSSKQVHRHLRAKP